MKTSNFALLSILAAAPAFAGNYGNTFSNTLPPPPPMTAHSCQCFAAGTQGFSLYGAAFTGAEQFDNCIGAGLSYSMFPTENVGAEFDGTWGFADSAIHTLNASLILRAPIPGACMAPYAILGVGVHANGVTEGTWHIGAGLDVRLTPDCFGIFADARYTFASESGNYTVVRAGVRWNF